MSHSRLTCADLWKEKYLILKHAPKQVQIDLKDFCLLRKAFWLFRISSLEFCEKVLFCEIPLLIFFWIWKDWFNDNFTRKSRKEVLVITSNCMIIYDHIWIILMKDEAEIQHFETHRLKLLLFTSQGGETQSTNNPHCFCLSLDVLSGLKVTSIFL